MLQNIRDNLQGVMAKVVIGIIIVPFAAFGLESLLSGGGSSEVVTINGEEVGEFEVQQAIQLHRRQLMSRMGENVDFSKLDENTLRKPALESLIGRRVMLQKAEAADLHVSDQTLDELIVQLEQFQVDGQFSSVLYENLLRSSGMTPQYYKSLLKRDLLIAQLSSPIAQGGFITAKELQLASRFTEEKRDIRFLTLPIADIEGSVVVSDEEIQQYYDDNQSKFYSEESVSIEYLEVKRSDFYLDVEESEIRAQYDQELSQLDVPVQRRVSHILIELDETSLEDATAKLKQIKERLLQGEDFSGLAKELSEDIGSSKNGGDLGFSQGDTFPEEFERALESMAVNDVSEPIETDAGLHLVQLTDIQKSTPPSFEDSKARILEEIQKVAAEGAYIEKVEQLADITFNSDNLAEPAEDLELPLNNSDFFTKRGGEGLLSNARVIGAAYSAEVLKNSSNSELLELNEDHTLVLRIKEHKPASLKPLEQVKQSVERSVQLKKAKAQLASQAEELLALLQKGGNIQKLANENGLRWQVTPSATRNSGGVDRQIITRAFELPVPGEGKQALDRVNLRNGDVVLLSISKVKEGSESDMPDTQRDGMKSYLGRTDGYSAFDVYQKNARKTAEVEIL